MGKQCVACGERSVSWTRLILGASPYRCAKCGQLHEFKLSRWRVGVVYFSVLLFFVAAAVLKKIGASAVWLLFLLSAITIATHLCVLSAPLQRRVQLTWRSRVKRLGIQIAVAASLLLAFGLATRLVHDCSFSYRAQELRTCS